MSEKLDDLIDEVFEYKKDELLKNIPPKDQNNYTIAIKSYTKEEIFKEIEQELKEKLIKEIQEELKEQSILNGISELTTLVISGFIEAFFVGLLVNQLTDFIGYYKGTIEIGNIWSTVILILIFFIICIIILAFMFISKIKKIYEEFRSLKK